MLFRRATLLSLVVASYISALPLYILALCYDALVSRSYLHVTLQPHITHPHILSPLFVYLLVLRVVAHA